MDATTGQVLFQANGHERLPIASTTKIMTAILALERGNLSDVVTASQHASETIGSTMYLEVGEQQTLENLLYALMMESANDAAVAIAEHIGGTEEQFVAMMNAKAQAIGATDTHYVNSHGLHDPDHYSTAHDLALIARYAMQNPRFRALVATEEKEIPGAGSNPPRELHSHDQLLGYYEGATGVKNGWTDEALQTNVASAKRDGTELIAVVLGAQDGVWGDSMALLDYGFSHFKTATLVKKGEPVAAATVPGAQAQVQALAAGDLSVSLPLDAAGEPEARVVWDDGLKLPLAQGAHLGKVEELEDGKSVGEVDLVAAQPVAAPPPPPVTRNPLRSGSGVFWVAGAVVALSVLTGRFARRRDRP